jgi:hypothetical protein
MYQISDSNLKKLELHSSKVLASEVCRIIEEFQKTQKNLNDESIVKLLKELIKNKIYESGRYRYNLIEQFSKGATYFNVSFAKPTKEL